MQKNELYCKGNSIVRILEFKNNNILVIDCIKLTMPVWISVLELNDWSKCEEDYLQEITNSYFEDTESLNPEMRKVINERYTMISPILYVLADEKKKLEMISLIAEKEKMSKQTVRKYLCRYLAFQNTSTLLSKNKQTEVALTKDEKNMRWALNKYYFSFKKYSLNTAYTMMLKAKYCNKEGNLLEQYPTFNQFRYFYRKRKNKQTYYISRNGLTNYQRNNRPLLGDGIQEFANAPGVGMLDSTICDVYLINKSGGIIGRPILTVCIDAYSSLCCGYSLSWEGGIYSVRQLMLNVISDKQEVCNQHGISIDKEEWNTSYCPGVLITDQGNEYKGTTFEQLTELGLKIINLPAYRPELKGSVEKFFSIIHDLFRPYLKGNGFISSDAQERGVHDYRKDARLTMEEFERIILRCILFYNSKRVIQNFPYTEEMINDDIAPYANTIFNYGLSLDGSNMIPIDKEKMLFTLLPRTAGKFTRRGLIVNGVRYKNENYAESFLSGGTVTVAYNPDDSTCVWLIENGYFVPFKLIEKRYENKNFEQIQDMKKQNKSIIQSAVDKSLQSKIDLANYIETIVNNAGNSNKELNDIKSNKQIEKQITRTLYTIREEEMYE